MKLSHCVQGRDNNFNLIRIVAAYAVLVTHSFALSLGTANAEPLRNLLGMTLGSIAVDVFFITSGFLVTASLLKRQSIIDFVWARAFRILPALFVMLLITIFGVGLFFTTRPWLSYFSDLQTYKYFFKCITLFRGVEFQLPGVFENNPYKDAVNGSLWTMPFEVKMYAILAFAWLVLRLTPGLRFFLFKVSVVLSAFVAGLLVILAHFNLVIGSSFLRLFFMFFTGACFYILRERIVLSYSLFISIVVILSLGIYDKDIFFVTYILTIAYVLFYLSYVPSGMLRKYNKLGDYSYGVYIYAFPVQQSIAALLPGVSVWSMLLLSTVISFVCAAFSWHLIEQHALKLKGFFSIHTKILLRIETAKVSQKSF